MTLEVIYVTRHGFRSNWVVDPSDGSYTAFLRSPTGGPADPALTAHGVEQAHELAARLLAAEPPIERVYSSTYYRCLQTVEPFVRRAPPPRGADGSPSPLRIRGETGLGEWYGSADFEHPAPASHEVLEPLFPGLLDPGYRPAVAPSRRGETIGELHDRVAAAADAVIAECDRDGVRAVLLCSHAAVVIALGRVLTGRMPDDVEVEDFRAFTCGLSVYRRRRGGSSVSSKANVAGAAAKGQNKDEGGIVAHHRETTAQCNTDDTDGNHGRDLAWRGGRGVGGGWDCELDSDCAHLSLGEERGWRFSGDESFKDTVTGQGMLDAGAQLGVVVEGRGKARGGRAEDPRGKL